MPYRVQLSRTRGWRLPENTVSVARPGRWGNPVIIGPKISRELAVDIFKDLMTGFFDPGKLANLTDPEFRGVHGAIQAWKYRLNWGLELQQGARSELGGKNLACWCRLGEACHADVLLAVANKGGRT